MLIKPVVPINSAFWDIVSDTNGEAMAMIDWDDLSAQVSAIYRSIPEDEKPRTVILADNYGEAGALDHYGEEYGLPLVSSGSNSLWYRGYGEFETETVIVVWFDRD